MKKLLVVAVLTVVALSACTALTPMVTDTPELPTNIPTPMPSATPIPPRGIEFTVVTSEGKKYTDVVGEMKTLLDALPSNWRAAKDAPPRYKITILSILTPLKNCYFSGPGLTGTLYRTAVDLTVTVTDSITNTIVTEPFTVESGSLDPECPTAETFTVIKGSNTASAENFLYPDPEYFSSKIVAIAVSLGLDLPMDNLPEYAYEVFDIAFSPDNQAIAIAGEDGIIKIIDIQTGKLVRILRGHAGSVTSIDFSSDGKTLVSGSNDMTVRIWNIETGEAEHLFKIGPTYENPSFKVDFSADDRFVGVSHRGSTVAFWNIASEQPVIDNHGAKFELEFWGFSSDSKEFIWSQVTEGGRADIVGDETYTTVINYSDTETGDLTRSVKKNFGLAFVGVISSDGRYFLARKNFCDLVVMDLASGKELRTTNYAKGKYGCEKHIINVAFSPSGDEFIQAVYSSNKSAIEIVNTATAKKVRDLLSFDDYIDILAWSPDGAMVAVGGAFESTVYLIDLQTGMATRTFSNTLSIPND